MHFSIAPVEIASHMRSQFDGAPTADRKQPVRRPGPVRHRLSVALHGLASRLEPTPAPAR